MLNVKSLYTNTGSQFTPCPPLPPKEKNAHRQGLGVCNLDIYSYLHFKTQQYKQSKGKKD